MRILTARVATASVVLLTLFPCQSHASNDSPSASSPADLEKTARTIRTGHPNDYIAAVVEPIGPITCQSDGPTAICRHHVRISELLCGRQKAQPWPSTVTDLYLFAGHDRNARLDRSLVVAYPSSDPREGYASMIMSPPTSEQVNAVRRACE